MTEDSKIGQTAEEATSAVPAGQPADTGSARDGSPVLRLYEASGQSTPGVRVTLHAPLESAFETNLIEQHTGELNVRDNALQFDLRPFEIRAFQLRLGASRTQR